MTVLRSWSGNFAGPGGSGTFSSGFTLNGEVYRYEDPPTPSGDGSQPKEWPADFLRCGWDAVWYFGHTAASGEPPESTFVAVVGSCSECRLVEFEP